MDCIKIISNGINQQEWQKQNLNVVNFANGDLITEVKTKQEKDNAIKNKIPAWCIDPNDPNCNEKLYNIYAINDSRGILPSGYRLPDKSDFKILESHLKNNSENYFNLNAHLNTRLSNWWSCSKFSHGENYSFHLEENWTKRVTSSFKDYCSVRGIKSSNKYLLDVEPILTSDTKKKILINIEKGDALFLEGKFCEAISTYI
jgi:uncharacterized protein (TIGR02145 family)